MSIPLAMPLISRGVPAYTNDDFTGAFPATHANDALYGGTDYWRCATTPTASANSGTLTQAVYLAYDLSGVSSTQRQQVLVHWDQSAVTGAYNPVLIANNTYNIATSYTIDSNTAAGGTLPTTGWTTLVTVSGSAPYHSRQHSVNLAGGNWIRMNVTAITGSAGNNNVALNMDIHDAHLGVQDSWFCAGDSITQAAFMYDETNGLSAVMPQQIATALPAYYPVWESGGIGGWTSTDVLTVFSTWLALFPGHYVTLNFGTNDANLGGTYMTTYQANMTNMIQQVLTAGKIPIVPHIPWLNTTAQARANVITLNGLIDTMVLANVGTLAGPDLYAFFLANQTLISGDNLHPTSPAGYNGYRTQWVDWAVANIYTLAVANRYQIGFAVWQFGSMY